ncbi:MAG: protein kinase [Myxococcaceae bacterium]|nr:protein kinase [Myxococcaceae bacterium]
MPPTMTETEHAFLGRYELLYLLGQGGMGEVHLARLSGAAGFEKLYIIKTILPQMNADPQFIARFHHEAKVLVLLNHSNIAQVADMGEVDRTLFMAIEYVPGVDLSRVMERARSAGAPLPIPVALNVGQRVCEALGYAHRKAGPDGAALGIVHRDVSPQNVMVSYEGEVKVIDFGLAKSSARSKATLPSTVMGKLGYMSPEQARGEAVDHRSDIYSAGIVVWELLAGRPLFTGATMGEMVAQMMNPQVPLLRSVRPEVSAKLEQVVGTALMVAPDARYQRCADFAHALNELAVREGLSIGSEDVGTYVRSVCPDEYDSERKLRSRLSEIRRRDAGQAVDHRPPEVGGPTSKSTPMPAEVLNPTRATPRPTHLSRPPEELALTQAPGSGGAPIQLRQSATVPVAAMGPRSELGLSVELPRRSKGPIIAAVGALVILLGGGGFAAWKISGDGAGQKPPDPPTTLAEEVPDKAKDPGEEVAKPQGELPPLKRIDFSGEAFKVITKDDELRMVLGPGVRFREGDAVKLIGPPLEGLKQRDFYGLAAVEQVKGSLVTLLSEREPATLPRVLFAARDDSGRKVQVVKHAPTAKVEPVALAEPGQKVGGDGQRPELTKVDTKPTPALPEPAKVEPVKPVDVARVDPVRAPEPEQPAPEVPVRAGLKVRLVMRSFAIGDYVAIQNHENQSLSGCLIILPGGFGYQYRAREFIRSNSEETVLHSSFSKYGWVGWNVADRQKVESNLKGSTAYIGCNEGVGYVEFTRKK